MIGPAVPSFADSRIEVGSSYAAEGACYWRCRFCAKGSWAGPDAIEHVETCMVGIERADRDRKIKFPFLFNQEVQMERIETVVRHEMSRDGSMWVAADANVLLRDVMDGKQVHVRRIVQDIEQGPPSSTSQATATFGKVGMEYAGVVGTLQFTPKPMP